MSSVLLSIKTDPKTKQDLKAFAVELGVSTTALVNLVLKQTLRDKKIVLNTDLEPTPYLEKLMKEAEAEYEAGETIHTNGKKQTLDYLNSIINK